MAKAPSNQPSPDDILEALREGLRLKREMGEATSAYQHFLKRAKSAGHSLVALKALIQAKARDPLEVQAEMRETIKYFNAAGLPVGQLELFQGVDISAPTAKSKAAMSLHDAEDAGYESGRTGGAIGDCPFSAGSEEYVAWRDGWQTGQTLIAEGKVAPPRAKKASTRTKKGRNIVDEAVATIN